MASLYVTKRQINAQVVSGNRQAWINTLRSAVTDFLTEIATDETKHQGPDKAIVVAHAKVRAISKYVTEIALLINPNEKPHQRLLELVRAAAADVNEFRSNPEISPMRHRKEIIDIAQQIFKEEWGRVKKGT